jgi:hypothetical protein
VPPPPGRLSLPSSSVVHNVRMTQDDRPG